MLTGSLVELAKGAKMLIDEFEEYRYLFILAVATLESPFKLKGETIEGKFFFKRKDLEEIARYLRLKFEFYRGSVRVYQKLEKLGYVKIFKSRDSKFFTLYSITDEGLKVVFKGLENILVLKKMREEEEKLRERLKEEIILAQPKRTPVKKLSIVDRLRAVKEKPVATAPIMPSSMYKMIELIERITRRVEAEIKALFPEDKYSICLTLSSRAPFISWQYPRGGKIDSPVHEGKIHVYAPTYASLSDVIGEAFKALGKHFNVNAKFFESNFEYHVVFAGNVLSQDHYSRTLDSLGIKNGDELELVFKAKKSGEF